MSRKIQRVILLLDSSGSMDGKPIENVKKAATTLSKKVDYYNSLSSRIEFQIITFATEAKFISRNNIHNIVASGRTNLADAYKKLNLIFRKHSKFDYPPIILLLCDGRPNICNHNLALEKLNHNPAFNDSLRIALAYGEQDSQTIKVLEDFAGNRENVFQNCKLSTIKYLIEQSVPKVIKQQAKADNASYTQLLRIIKNDVKKIGSLRNGYAFKRNI